MSTSYPDGTWSSTALRPASPTVKIGNDAKAALTRLRLSARGVLAGST